MKISLNQQIDEVDRELKVRSDVYPRQVASGAMRQSIAHYQVERMQAVKATLEWLRENEVEIRAWVEARLEKRRQAEAKAEPQ